MPLYGGQSLLNVPGSICAALGVSTAGLGPPLEAGVLPPAMLGGVRSVVLLVVDGLGRWQLDGAIARGQAPTLAGLATEAAAGSPRVSLATITSVFPSSTVPALTTLNTGLPPAEHGLIGWTMFLEEFGERAESARWGPAAGSGSYLDERLGGHDPRAFLGVETLHSRLAGAGVRPTVVGPAGLRRSGFSRMVFDGAEYRGTFANSSLFVAVEEILARPRRDRRRFVYVYWDALDLVAHLHGPRTPEHREELAALDFLLGRWLARQQRRRDVLFLLTADHGHVDSPEADAVRLDQDDALLGLLRAPPSGERRLVYLHARPGQAAVLRVYCAERLGELVELVEPEAAFAAGWFGPGPVAPAARRRAGDLMLLARPGVQLVYPASERPAGRIFGGNHGGMAPDEMLVPLLALRL